MKSNLELGSSYFFQRADEDTRLSKKTVQIRRHQQNCLEEDVACCWVRYMVLITAEIPDMKDVSPYTLTREESTSYIRQISFENNKHVDPIVHQGNSGAHRSPQSTELLLAINCPTLALRKSCSISSLRGTRQPSNKESRAGTGRHRRYDKQVTLDLSNPDVRQDSPGGCTHMHTYRQRDRYCRHRGKKKKRYFQCQGYQKSYLARGTSMRDPKTNSTKKVGLLADCVQKRCRSHWGDEQLSLRVMMASLTSQRAPRLRRRSVCNSEQWIRTWIHIVMPCISLCCTCDLRGSFTSCRIPGSRTYCELRSTSTCDRVRSSPPPSLPPASLLSPTHQFRRC